MADHSDAQLKHELSLERLERSHANALQRQRENALRRNEEKRDAAIISGENAEALMELKHKLDKENRQLDHIFNRAEDAREVERLATEIALRRRDDFIRQQWESEAGLFALEAKVIEAVTHGAIAERKSKLDHSHHMEAKQADHENAKDFKKHDVDEEIRLFEAKERIKLKIAREGQSHIDEDVQAAHTRLKKQGIIKDGS